MLVIFSTQHIALFQWSEDKCTHPKHKFRNNQYYVSRINPTASDSLQFYDQSINQSIKYLTILNLFGMIGVQLSKFHRKGSTVSNKFCDFQDKYMSSFIVGLEVGIFKRGGESTTPNKSIELQKSPAKAGLHWLAWGKKICPNSKTLPSVRMLAVGSKRQLHFLLVALSISQSTSCYLADIYKTH